ncbi:MAG: multiprotein-bridging factor 1 family protein [Arenibacterium sp.]
MSDQETSPRSDAAVEFDWFGPDTATFGDRVAGAREVAGMSQAHLARLLGVKKSTLIGWEDDVSEPRANKLSMMAGLLNVSITWLLTGEGEGVALDDDADVHTDLADYASELREIRSLLRTATERAARLEKHMRKTMEAGKDE